METVSEVIPGLMQKKQLTECGHLLKMKYD